MIVLTGPPRIEGIDRRYPSLDGWLECFWDDSESIWHSFDDGSRAEHRRRFRLVGQCRWDAATEQEALALASDLRGVFDVVPRTRLDGDPEWAEEITVPCRRLSRLPATRPIALRNSARQKVWRVELSFESCTVYADIPGVATGGFYLVGEDEENVTLDPWGEATITDGDDIEVVFTDYEGATEVVTVETYRLGTPTVVAMRTEEVTTPEPAYRIHTSAPPA